jgi:hypothetical protein
MSDQATATNQATAKIRASAGFAPKDSDLSGMFLKASDPALVSLLMKFGELIEAGKLPGASFSEWEKGVAESEEQYEAVKRMVQRNLARETSL